MVEASNTVTCLISQYLYEHSIKQLCSNPFTRTHSDNSTLGFVCGLCLSSLVTFTLFSLMRAISLTALCLLSSLLWCGAFHYTGQLELLGNACGGKKKE